MCQIEWVNDLSTIAMSLMHHFRGDTLEDKNHIGTVEAFMQK